MNFKEIILAGGIISFSYKEEHKDWIGTAKIWGFQGGMGMRPEIVVEIGTVELARGGRKEFDWSEIDEAINIYKKLVFRPENLCYKMTETMVYLYNQGEGNLDLEIPADFEKVRKLQKEKQKDSWK